MKKQKKHTELSVLKGKIRAEKTNYEKVSKKMGIETATLSNKINGYTTFNITEVEKLVAILNIDMDDINYYFFPDILRNAN